MSEIHDHNQSASNEQPGDALAATSFAALVLGASVLLADYVVMISTDAPKVLEHIAQGVGQTAFYGGALGMTVSLVYKGVKEAHGPHTDS